MQKINFICTCNFKHNLFSSYNKDILINSCSNCHNYYTNKKNINFSEKIIKFKNKYNDFFK